MAVTVALRGRHGTNAPSHVDGATGRFDPLPLITHRFSLDDIVEAYDCFGSRRDGVLNVAIQA